MPRLLLFEDLREHGVPYHRNHVARLERAGKFPRRVPIGDSRIGWVEDEVDAWVDEKIKARSTLAGVLGSNDSVGQGATKKRGSQT